MPDLTKQQLIDTINAKYIGVIIEKAVKSRNPDGTVKEYEPAFGGVQRYIANCIETGYGALDKLPTWDRVNIAFYVFNEGLTDEKAGFHRIEPKNNSNTDISSASANFLAYETIYSSADMRRRVRGWLIKKVLDILANNGSVSLKRKKFAMDALHNIDKYLNDFMCYIAMSDDIRAKGNSALDTDFAWLGYMVDNICDYYGFTN